MPLGLLSEGLRSFVELEFKAYRGDRRLPILSTDEILLTLPMDEASR
jgi:hypothetical protein